MSAIRNKAVNICTYWAFPPGTDTGVLCTGAEFGDV